MNKELTAQLYVDYPDLFCRVTMSRPNRFLGLSCDDGWYHIVDQTCQAIRAYVDDVNRERARHREFRDIVIHKGREGVPSWFKAWAELEDIPDDLVMPEIIQIKEKFGTLSFYTNAGDSTLQWIIGMGSRMSGVTCEQCGLMGAKRVGGGWIKTLCEEHAEIKVAADDKRKAGYMAGDKGPS
jgi:hypothetical protein